MCAQLYVGGPWQAPPVQVFVGPAFGWVTHVSQVSWFPLTMLLTRTITDKPRVFGKHSEPSVNTVFQ